MPGPEVVALLQTFAAVFTRPTFAHALVLLYGAILAPGRRTVAAALREYLARHQPDAVTAALDAVYASESSNLDPALAAAAARNLERTEW